MKELTMLWFVAGCGMDGKRKPITGVASNYNREDSSFDWLVASRSGVFDSNQKAGQKWYSDQLCNYAVGAIKIISTFEVDGEEQPKQPAVREHGKKYDRFKPYLTELVELYQQTNDLRGIAKVARKYKCACLTKVQFFQLGLDKLAAAEINDDCVRMVRDAMCKK